MANNLRVFNLINDYNEAELVKPSVSFVVENGNVYYDDVPSPTFQGKWLATYSDSHTESAECDSSSAITQNEINGANLVSVEIGDCVEVIGNYAFSGCTSLTSISIPSGVTSIGSSAFQFCSGLTSIDIPSGVTFIGDYVFGDCRKLSSVTIPNGFTYVNNGMFQKCYALTSIDIPSGVTSIGTNAFGSCRSLTSITVNAITPPTLGGSVFNNTNNCPIYVPSQSVEAYKSASGWSDYADRIYPIS